MKRAATVKLMKIAASSMTATRTMKKQLLKILVRKFIGFHTSISRYIADVSDDEEIEEAEEKTTDELLGGLFKKTVIQKEAPLDDPNAEDGFAYLASPTTSASLNDRDWSFAGAKEQLCTCFVTGKWDESEGEDAMEAMEGEDDDDDEYQEEMDVDQTINEDKHAAANSGDAMSQNGEDPSKQQPRARNKKGKERLKSQYDAEFDETNEYYNTLKEELNEQAKVRLFVTN